MSSRIADNENGNELLVRVSGYVLHGERDYLYDELHRVGKLEGLHNASMGTLLSSICKYRLRLDIASLSKYTKTHHNSKRGRDQDPARP